LRSRADEPPVLRAVADVGDKARDDLEAINDRSLRGAGERQHLLHETMQAEEDLHLRTRRLDVNIARAEAHAAVDDAIHELDEVGSFAACPRSRSASERKRVCSPDELDVGAAPVGLPPTTLR